MRNTHFLKPRQPVEGVFAHKGNSLGDSDLFQALRYIGSIRLVSACAENKT